MSVRWEALLRVEMSGGGVIPAAIPVTSGMLPKAFAADLLSSTIRVMASKPEPIGSEYQSAEPAALSFLSNSLSNWGSLSIPSLLASKANAIKFALTLMCVGIPGIDPRMPAAPLIVPSRDLATSDLFGLGLLISVRSSFKFRENLISLALKAMTSRPRPPTPKIWEREVAAVVAFATKSAISNGPPFR